MVPELYGAGSSVAQGRAAHGVGEEGVYGEAGILMLVDARVPRASEAAVISSIANFKMYLCDRIYAVHCGFFKALAEKTTVDFLPPAAEPYCERGVARTACHCLAEVSHDSQRSRPEKCRQRAHW
jgi:hypothetical protein